MRPYAPSGKNYRVQQHRGAPAVIRPNRLAAGMAFTASRSGHWADRLSASDSLRLSIRGTLARSMAVGYLADRNPCPCCGSRSPGRLTLNANGRACLEELRERRAKRSGPTNDQA